MHRLTLLIVNGIDRVGRTLPAVNVAPVVTLPSVMTICWLSIRFRSVAPHDVPLVRTGVWLS